MAQPVHLQYNSPAGLYSRETAEEQFNQQLGQVLQTSAGTIPLPAPVAEKHFDPTRSKVLQEIQNESEDTFGQHFAEKIARAETPKLPPQQEPSWAGYAREKSERARSRTPHGREYTPVDPQHNLYQHQHQPLGAAEEAREYAEKSRSFVHSTDQPHFGPSYYEVQQPAVGRRHSGTFLDRGYELGGMDYTKGLDLQGDPTAVYLSHQRRSPSQPRPVGYIHGGQDYGTGYIGHGPYHGHGPDPPRLRPHFSANPHEPINNYVAPNIDAVDPTLLVGDTLSNHKIRSAAPPPEGHFGTSFAPAPGRISQHRMVRAEPRSPSPVSFSLHARKPAGQSSAPPHQQDVWRYRQAESDKQVTIATLLNDDVLRVRPSESIPYWSDSSLKKSERWKHRSDPRLDRPEIYQSEPNWKRNVDERKNAWERRAFETELRVNLPASAKVEPDAPPQWHNRAEYTHNVWNRAAEQQSRQHSAYSPQPRHFTQQQQQQQQQKHYNTGSYSQPQQLYTGSQLQSQQSALSQSQHSPLNYSYHASEKSGDPASGNYSLSERHESERRGEGSLEMNRFSRSEKKTTTHSSTAASTVPAPPPPPPARTQDSTRQPPVESRHGIETDVLNRGFNSNQVDYVHHHERGGISPGRVSSSSTSQLANGGHRYTNFSREVAGEPGGPSFSSSEKYESETRRPGGHSFERSSYSHSEERSSSAAAAAPLPPLNRNEQQRETEKREQQRSSYSSSQQQYSSEHRDQQSKTTTTTQSIPITANTSYNYIQQPHITSSSPGQTRYEKYYSSRREESQKEESRPQSRQSLHSEQRSYKEDYEKKSSEKTTTSTTATVPVVLPPPLVTTSTTSTSKLSQDAFDRKAEMSESLPRGTISNTLNNTQGAYRDVSGHDVSYKRELSTATDPGKERALLKEEEKRVVETPLEPGVISRHVTTKYYKKKTTTDTTTTSTTA